MAGPVTPMVVLGVTSYANQWYNGGSPTDVKPLLFAGIGALLLEAVAAIPKWEPVATAIGWLAVVGYFISPEGNGSNSPVQNLLAISQGKGK